MPTFRLTVRGDHPGAGAPAYNIWHLRATNLWASQNEVENAITSLRAFYTALKPYYPTAVVWSVPYDLVQHGDDYEPGVGGTDTSEAFTTVAIPGSGGISWAPAPVAAVVGWETAIRSRSSRGRTFLGPLAQVAIDENNGTLRDTACTAFRAAANTLIQAGEGPDGWSFGVYSRLQNVIRDFTDYTVHDKCAVLRSRRD